MVKVYTGEGTLFERETNLGRVRYHITAQRLTIPTPTMQNPGGEVEGMLRVVGTLEPIDGRPDFWDLLNRSVPLTLKFDGGGQWGCFLQSIDGRVVSRGDFEPPKE